MSDVNIYARRTTRLLLMTVVLLLFVGSIAILSPNPFTIGCDATCALCLILSIRYLVRRTLTKKERP
jgi:hypothetical protein